MKRIFVRAGIFITILTLSFFSISASTSDDESDIIYALRIDNINRHGADFYWSTSIETKGSVDYAYTKLRELYNPQLPGSQQTVLLSAVPMQTRSEEYFVKDHHIKVDNLDMESGLFVEYTIKSQAFDGEIYEIPGEFVLVDTQKVDWWQNWQFAIFFPITMFILGNIAWPTIFSKIVKRKPF